MASIHTALLLPVSYLIFRIDTRACLALAATAAVSVVGFEAYVVPGAVVLASVGAVAMRAEEEEGTLPVVATSQTKTSTSPILALTNRQPGTRNQHTEEEVIQVQEAMSPALATVLGDSSRNRASRSWFAT
jgi:hypothetical protein